MHHLRRLLKPDELAQAQALLATAPWQDGRATAGAQAAGVKNNEQIPRDSEAARALQSLVTQALERSADFLSAALPKRLLPPMFNRYAGAHNAYGDHVDQAVRYHPSSGQAIRTDLSCTVFLSSPGDYDGGELVIDDAAGPRAFKLPAGDALLYPATTVHRVEPVTRGARLAGFFWVESLVRGGEHRQLLFGMDRALTSLRERHGESPETVALTGTYHNLLRLWADT